MKSLIAIVLAVSLFPVLAHAGPKKKTSHNAAKKECLHENPELKGRALQKCISLKRK